MGAWTLTQTFDFDGRSVRHDRWGEGPAVVLVHGTPWSSFNMRHLMRRLARDHTVYAFDLLGYGQSDKGPGDVSLGVQNRLLVRLLAHWGLQCPVVIGHDFGGATVLRSHLLHPQPYARIVLIDPVALAPWGSPFFQHVQAHEAAFAGVPAYIHEAIVRAYVQTAAHRPLDEQTLQGILAPWSGVDGQAAFYRQIAQADERFTDEVQPRYGSIDTPVLILWGRQDGWIPLARGEALHAMIPGSELRVIDDAGHLVIEEQPDALVREIRAFIGRD
jgi:pimeloyl-ACP methyl ester carboxylesterase